MIKLKKLNSVQNIRLEAVVSHILFFLINTIIFYIASLAQPASDTGVFGLSRILTSSLLAALFELLVMIMYFYCHVALLSSPRTVDSFRFNLKAIPKAMMIIYGAIAALFVFAFVSDLMDKLKTYFASTTFKTAQTNFWNNVFEHVSKQTLINMSIGFAALLIVILIVMFILRGKPDQVTESN